MHTCLYNSHVMLVSQNCPLIHTHTPLSSLAMHDATLPYELYNYILYSEIYLSLGCAPCCGKRSGVWNGQFLYMFVHYIFTSCVILFVLIQRYLHSAGIIHRDFNSKNCLLRKVCFVPSIFIYVCCNLSTLLDINYPLNFTLYN